MVAYVGLVRTFMDDSTAPLVGMLSTFGVVQGSGSKVGLVHTEATVTSAVKAGLIRTYGLVDTGFNAQALNDFTVNPFEIVEATATFSSTPDSVVWSQTSGPAVTVTNLSNTGRFVAPPTIQGATVRLIVTATKNGQSVVSDVIVTIRPHKRWRPGPGNTLVAVRRVKPSTEDPGAFGAGTFGSGIFGD